MFGSFIGDFSEMSVLVTLQLSIICVHWPLSNILNIDHHMAKELFGLKALGPTKVPKPQKLFALKINV